MAVLEASAHRSTRARSVAAAPPRDSTRPSRREVVLSERVLAPVACEHRRAPVPLGLMVALGLAVCLAVVGLGVLAGASAGSPTVPARTAVVRVEPGENLLQVAQRVAPHSDPAAVVDRIRDLNGLPNSSVHAGQPLTVPSEG